ncbi:FctA domain-containing protein [Ventrimonas sp. CLA-AP-H27]|uniref:FctA domain-containing protein n=1 Tax=Ventrimonas faecis TaxID=3133170 RepID=A0ABV1HHY8_9FIRM
MRKMKKALATVLAATMVMGMSSTAWAEPKTNQDASFTKTYKITNPETANPKETFTFTFTPVSLTESNANLTTRDMPTIAAATTTFEAGKATTAGLEQTVDVALKDIVWPGVGIYIYNVTETAGKTAGVTYDTRVAKLKVTVAYDQGTKTYYTAFCTLALEDKDKDGITDVKTTGFTNEYSAGSLAISKTVTGNMGDQSAYFKVTVTLNGEEGKNYAESYTVSGGSFAGNGTIPANPTSITVGTPADFYLKHGETITIANLPYGVTYSVVEDDYTDGTKGGYDTAIYDCSDRNDVKIIDTAKETVDITNNKGVTVDTGITLDSLPYIMILAVAALGMVGFVAKKRKEEEMF